MTELYQSNTLQIGNKAIYTIEAYQPDEGMGGQVDPEVLEKLQEIIDGLQ